MTERRISYNNGESIVDINNINANEELRNSDVDKLTTTTEAETGVKLKFLQAS
jgi:hypothetical protein